MTWDNEEIEKTIYELNDKASLNEMNDAHDIYVSDVKDLQTLYKQVKEVNINPLYITQKYRILSKSILTKNVNDILMSDDLNQILHNDQNQEIIDKPYSMSTKIKLDKALSLISSSLNDDERSYLNKLIDTKKIFISDKPCFFRVLGFNVHLLTTNSNYIYAQFKRNLYTTSIINHEISHTLLNKYCPNDSISGLTIYEESFFCETYPILRQLLFIDELECKDKEKSSLMHKFITNYQGYIRDSMRGVNTQYAYSSLLAFYLYKVYYEDKNKFDNLIKLYKEHAYTSLDSELLNTMGITSTDLETAFKYYISKYENKLVKHV